jgi:chemotaxis protein MotB
MGPGGASTSPINLRGGMDAPKSALTPVPGVGAPLSPPSPAIQKSAAGALDAEEARKIAEADEKKKLVSLMEDLRKAISESQALRPFKDQLLLDITPEGLRIQIVDEQNRAMFDLGSSRLKDYTDRILRELSTYLNSVPNRISLTGHTDVKPYGGRSDYSNWELSADRANAARRALVAGGLSAEKVARVVGLSSAVLFDRDHPEDPINRRISIIVMTKRAEEAALKTDEPPQRAASEAEPSAAAPPTAPPSVTAPPASAAAPAALAPSPPPAAG